VDMNPNPGKGWTDAEEATFSEIMRIGRMERIKAIQLFRRCKSDHAKAVKLARDNYGLSDLQIAAYERSEVARSAGLVKARQKLTQDRPIELLELHA
jgi:hypothetical protein